MLYIVPSRGRPANIVDLIKAWEATRHFAELWICIDDDDPKIGEYKSIPLPSWARMFVGPRTGLGPTLNHYAFQYIRMTRNHPDWPMCIGFMGDDHRPVSGKWDLKIQHAADHNCDRSVIYGNDLLQGHLLPTAVAITADIVETLGYFCPPSMRHLYLDNAWADIGRAVGNLVYLPNVIIEHCHPVNGKAEWDDGYREVNGGQMYAEDSRAYQAWQAQIDWPIKLRELGGIA